MKQIKFCPHCGESVEVFTAKAHAPKKVKQRRVKKSLPADQRILNEVKRHGAAGVPLAVLGQKTQPITAVERDSILSTYEQLGKITKRIVPPVNGTGRASTIIFAN